MAETRIVRIEWARLAGQRPRLAGGNARLGQHGQEVRPGLARVTASDGLTGFGWSAISREEAAALAGATWPEAFDPAQGPRQRFRRLEYALWDLAGRRANRPVYALLGGAATATEPLCVPCYDTSLYMDDLHLADDGEAAELIAAEAAEGLERGHRSFKVKVGRGAMHMALEQGTRRDILVIRAVRRAVGPQARLMIDANNGYNLNLAWRVLAETADANLHWLEEPFHEDPRLYARLKERLAADGLGTLLADGEGDASPHLLQWARDGLVDVIQYDVLHPGFGAWLELGPQLDRWGLRSAPHHYGEPYGNYAAGHLAAAIRGLEAVEWDEATVPGLDASAYAIAEGHVHLPPLPGFGLHLDGARFARAVADNGFVVEAA